MPESTVKSWATRYWKKEKVATKKDAKKGKKVATEDATNEPKKRGAQNGNVNAVGDSGGVGLPGNQNAFKHGGYAAILFDTLDDTEQSLIGQMNPNAEQLLIDEINLLTVRERRIMQRIQEYQKTPLAVASTSRTETKRAFDSKEDENLYVEMIQEKIEEGKRLPGRDYTSHTDHRGIL